MDFTVLPTVNASLNGLAGICLVAGWVMIRQRRIEAHRACMIAAFSCSVLFLVSYLFYHYNVGSVKFAGPPGVRRVYLGILLTHTVLAALVPFLAVVTLFRALQQRFDQHRKIARWTLPIWLYVSATGVVVYWMLYRVQW